MPSSSWMPALLLFLSLVHNPAQALHLVTEDFPPFTYPTADQPSQAAGPMVEAVKIICRRLNTPCQIELLPWQRALALAERNEVDGIFSLIRLPEREEKYFFPPMLLRSSYSVFRHKAYPYLYNRPTDLSRHKLGVYGPSGASATVQQVLQSVPQVDLVLVSDNRRLLRMLELGRFGPHGLIVANRHVARRLITQERLDNIVEAGTLQVVEYGIALSKQRLNEKQLQEFNEVVVEAIRDGTLPELFRQHGLEPAAYNP